MTVDTLLKAARERPGLACFDTADGITVITWGNGTPHTSPNGWQAMVRESLQTPTRPAAVFSGGVVGWIGYEAGRSVEQMPRPTGNRATHDVCLWRTNGAILFDRSHGRWSIEGSPDFRADAEGLVDAAGVAPHTPRSEHTHRPWQPDDSTTRSRWFQSGVRSILDAVREGEVYQVNLAWEHQGVAVPDALSAWLALRGSNPALRGAYLRQGPTEVVSNSPELFLNVDGPTGAVESLPIKGTAPVSTGPEGRAHLERSGKERAELTMIVDLMRNDLGRVARPGSVRASERTIRQCGDLWHAEQAVRAVLSPGRDAVDAVAAAFPPGSVTGAPKVRAMQVIHELEASPRGIYTGAIGWFADGGGAHFNVAIRTATVVNGVGRFHVGAGIVAESDPHREWNETLAKAQALAHGLEA